MKQERRQNGRCNRVARLEKPDGLSEARDFSHGFFTEDYFNSHRTGSLVVGKKIYKIRIFAVLECEATEESIFAPTENDNTLNYIKQHALFMDDTALPKDNEKLLGLSTCKYPDTVDRTLIFGALDG